MDLNGIPLRSYEDKGTVFNFYLTNCTMADVMKLDGKQLTITDNLKTVRVFVGLRAVSIEDKGNQIVYSAARKLDPDTKSAIEELQSNLLSEREARQELEALVDASAEVIDLFIAQSAPEEEGE